MKALGLYSTCNNVSDLRALLFSSIINMQVLTCKLLKSTLLHLKRDVGNFARNAYGSVLDCFWTNSHASYILDLGSEKRFLNRTEQVDVVWRCTFDTRLLQLTQMFIICCVVAIRFGL